MIERRARLREKRAEQLRKRTELSQSSEVAGMENEEPHSNTIVSKSYYPDFDDEQLPDSLDMYKRSISGIEFYTFEEEKVKTIQISQTTDPEKRKEYISEFAEHYLPFVVTIANQYWGRNVSPLDLIQEGNIGLLKAVNTFDPTKGFRFITYIEKPIRGAIWNAVTDYKSTIKRPDHKNRAVGHYHKELERFYEEFERYPTEEELARWMGISKEKVNTLRKLYQFDLSLNAPINEEGTELGAFIPDDRPDPEDEALSREVQEEVHDAIRNLSEREQSVLKLRYGFQMTQTEVGREFGVIRQMISKIEARAMEKLRRSAVQENSILTGERVIYSEDK